MMWFYPKIGSEMVVVVDYKHIPINSRFPVQDIVKYRDALSGMYQVKLCDVWFNNFEVRRVSLKERFDDFVGRLKVFAPIPNMVYKSDWFMKLK